MIMDSAEEYLKMVRIESDAMPVYKTVTVPLQYQSTIAVPVPSAQIRSFSAAEMTFLEKFNTTRSHVRASRHTLHTPSNVRALFLQLVLIEQTELPNLSLTSLLQSCSHADYIKLLKTIRNLSSDKYYVEFAVFSVLLYMDELLMADEISLVRSVCIQSPVLRVIAAGVYGQLDLLSDS
ncbi:hypothetical protein MP638_000747 [Amoeboaphelidium occidentale]|nr:hypothetical protein MP638_000747 [Amoeboaphelidium occidentale]